MSRRDHNRRQIERYLIYREIVYPSSAGSIVDGTTKVKPTSSPAISDKGLSYIDIESNRDAARLIEPELSRLRRLSGIAKYRPLWQAVDAVTGYTGSPDYGALKRWRAGETEEACRMVTYFEAALDLFEMRINLQTPPGYRLEVVAPKRRDDYMLSNHAVAMKEGIERKKRRHYYIFDYFKALSADIPRMRRYEITATAYGVHPDTVRNAVRYFTTRKGY